MINPTAFCLHKKNKLKSVLLVACMIWALLSCGQATKEVVEPGQYTVLARFISFEGGDKISFARFYVIKDLAGNSIPRDTIFVGFYNDQPPENDLGDVILNLDPYKGTASQKNYFICAGYDGKTGIQKTRIDHISFAYWEGCETGKDNCTPLQFTRPQTGKRWFLVMPCGGTETAVTISGLNNGYSKKLHLFSDGCPPCIELTEMADGKYSAFMMACGLGGGIGFSLVTEGQ